MAILKPFVKAAGKGIKEGFENVTKQGVETTTKNVLEEGVEKSIKHPLPPKDAATIINGLGFEANSQQATYINYYMHALDGPGIMNTIQKGDVENIEKLKRYITDFSVYREPGALNEIGHIADNGTNDLIQDTGKAQNAQAAMEGASPEALQPKPAQPRPSRRDITKDQFEEIEIEFQEWVNKRLKDVNNNPKKINRQEFAPEGIWVGDEKFQFTGLSAYAKSGGKGPRPTLKTTAYAEKRAKGMSPSNDPRVIDFFEKGHAKYAKDLERFNRGEITKDQIMGINPKYNVETFDAGRGSYIKQGAATKDLITSEIAKSMGWNKPVTNAISDWARTPKALDKEHARAIFGGASNDWLSQFYGSQMLNRSQGKLASFLSSTMEILGAPTNKTTFSFDAKTGTKVRNKHARAQWSANEESAANWAAAQMARDRGRPYYNPAATLSNADWLRIQDAFNRPGVSQEQVAMKVLREGEIRRAWLEADLGEDKESLEILREFAEKLWAVDIKDSELILERTVGEQAFKRVMREMYRIQPHKGVKGQGRMVRNKLAPYEGVNVVDPKNMQKIDPTTGTQPQTRRALGKLTPELGARSRDLGHGDVTKLAPDPKAQENNEFVKNLVEQLISPDQELEAAFGSTDLPDVF